MKRFLKLNWPSFFASMSLLIYHFHSTLPNNNQTKYLIEIFMLFPSIILIGLQIFFWQIKNPKILKINIPITFSLLIINTFYLTNAGYLPWFRNEALLGYWLTGLLLAGILIIAQISIWLFLLLRHFRFR